ncbi:MAG: LysM peptidoglycan-binding domain-containing protein [Flavobacterium sp.]|nr:MAG: LysM peptidoglycan-binding domain-containing protein [Flavobacterium sp.]
MFKKLALLFFAILIASCGSHKQVAKNTTYKRPRPVTTTRKPVVKRPAVVTRKPASRPSASQNPQLKTIEGQYEGAKEPGKSTANETVYSKQEILEATTRVKVTTAMVLDYIRTYKDIAKSNMQQYGIPASIILGQGILESGAGTGPLSALANNHFGIKCHKDWTGPSVAYDDDTAQECFRKYDQPAQSYQDHAIFLTGRDRYAFLFQLDKRDYAGWARGLKAAGYATDPRYPEKLIGIIERYQLSQYDAEVTGTEFVPLNTAPLLEKPIAANTGNADFYQVVQGDTLYSISKRFNVSIDDLRRNNNLSENAISIGQLLKIK